VNFNQFFRVCLLFPFAKTKTFLSFCINHQAAFFGGLSPEVRKEAWKFLLQYFPFGSTYKQRELLQKDKEQEYMEIDHLRYVFLLKPFLNLSVAF